MSKSALFKIITDKLVKEAESGAALTNGQVGEYLKVISEANITLDAHWEKPHAALIHLCLVLYTTYRSVGLLDKDDKEDMKKFNGAQDQAKSALNYFISRYLDEIKKEG